MDASNISTEPAIPAGLLASALEEARARAADLEARIGALVTEREACNQEIQLLERLQAIRGGDGTRKTTGKAGDSVSEAGPKRVGGAATQEAVALLQEAGRPLHISELMRGLEVRQVEIPGAGTQANLIAHLMRDDRVVRPQRGMYALGAWGFSDAAPLKRAKKKRVTGKSKQGN